VYESYADDVTNQKGRMRLHALLQNSDAIITLEVPFSVLLFIHLLVSYPL